MPNYKTIEDVDVKGKRVLVRLDLNVPLKKGEIKDDTRINAALETIKYLIGKDAKVILMSHLGRPEGKANPKLSLKVVAEALKKKLNMEITMAPDCVGEKVDAIVNEMKDKDVVLLENLRFHSDEEDNKGSFVGSLAKLADVYINDAFGTAHRAHASTAGVPLKLIKEGKDVAAGFLMKKELDIWKGVVHSKGIKILVIGGKKLKEKMKAIINLSPKCKYVVAGGVPYSVLQKAAGNDVGSSLVSEKNSDVDYVKSGQEILSKHDNIILGEEVVIAKKDGDNWTDQKKVSIKEGVPEGYAIVDIILSDKEKAYIKACDYVIAFGPLGIFEAGFKEGTQELAKAISLNPEVKVIVGGGDSAEAYKGVPSMKISTGGGASISYLKDGTLDALEALEGNEDYFKKE